MNRKIVFLGAGNMAEALINGLLKSRIVSPGKITATDVRSQRLSYIKRKFKVNVEGNNCRAIERSDIIFLAVKPQNINELLSQVGSSVSAKQLVISIAAGVTTKRIENFTCSRVPVVRAMPNTPALLSKGAIALSCGKHAKKNHLDFAVKLFSTVGIVVKLPESKINAVTALSGSGPAYVFYLCEAMEQAGLKIGLPKDIAKKLSRQTVLGSGQMLHDMDLPASELRRRVTSPGGTTEAAIKYMEKNKVLPAIVQAIKEADKRAFHLSG